ncbi:MAG TPA: hypothetical protein VMO88_10775, partial [Acidimicrobiales bacterium]|nr:hypothetical protein [Acidimicrobiales bacterium]
TSSVATRTVLPAGTVVAVVSNASGTKVKAATSQALTTVAFGGVSVPISVTVERLGGHLSAGETVATVTVGSGSGTGTPALALSAMPAPTWGWRLSHIF